MTQVVLKQNGIVMLMLLTALACSDPGNSNNMDASIDGGGNSQGTDSSTDADTDADSDTDTDTDSDTDTDTDSDTDTDTDLDGGSDGDTDTDSDTDGDSDSESTLDSDDDSDSNDGGDDTDSELDCVALEGEGWAFNPANGSCKDCRHKLDYCNDNGEGVFYKTTLQADCVCHTHPGDYYSSTSYDVIPCDADGDGWISVTANGFVDHTDSALKENARCDVREIEQVIFISESNESTPLPISHFLPDQNRIRLYEPDDRDNDDFLSEDSNAPAYGTSGRKLQASELNGFTKACVSSIADYNGNGASDISEWQGAAGIDDLFTNFAPFAYFMETHRGWYEEVESADTVIPSYVIKERTRVYVNNNPDGLPVNYSGHMGDYWETCFRETDSAYTENGVGITMDFAGVAGQFHHSQFKCLEVVSDGTPFDQNAPQHIAKDSLKTLYQLNSCSVSEDTVEKLVMPNPTEAPVRCTAQGHAAVSVGDVGFSVSLYHQQDDTQPYVRGCKNQCLYGLDDGIDNNEWLVVDNCKQDGQTDEQAIAQFECEPNESNFGEAICGCNGNFDNFEGGCNECINHFDFSTDCLTCLEGPSTGFWGGNDCNECASNFDIHQSNQNGVTCTSCLSNDQDGYWAGDMCEHCESMGIDESTNCTQCHLSEQNGFWADTLSKPPIKCGQCLNHWEGNDCDRCPEDRDPKLVYDIGNPGVLLNPLDTCKDCWANTEMGFWQGDNCDVCQTNRYNGVFEDTDLLVNGGAESSDMVQWTNLIGNLVRRSEDTYVNASMEIVTVLPQEGDLFFKNAGESSAQNLSITVLDVDISKYQWILLNETNDVEIDFSGYFRVQRGGYQIVTELLDPGDFVLEQTTNNYSNTSWRNRQLASSRVPSNTTKIRVKILGTAGSGAVYMDNLSMRLFQNKPIDRPCTVCTGGHTTDTAISEDNCELCQAYDGIDQLGHWSSDCLSCETNNGENHFGGASCDQCTALWGPAESCNTCDPMYYKEDDFGNCNQTQNLALPIGSDQDTAESWDCERCTLTKVDDPSAPSSYYMKYNSGGTNPFAWKRIDLTGIEKHFESLSEDDGTGKMRKLRYSVKVRSNNDSADKVTLRVYQGSNSSSNSASPTINDIECTTETSTSESWTTLSGTCSPEEGTKQLYVAIEVQDNDNNAKGYFSSLELWYTTY